MARTVTVTLDESLVDAIDRFNESKALREDFGYVEAQHNAAAYIGEQVAALVRSLTASVIAKAADPKAERTPEPWEACPYPWALPAAQAILEEMVRICPDLTLAIELAQRSANIDPASVETGLSLRNLWRGLLKRAAIRGTTYKLVQATRWACS
jgi:hypothetical protein